MKGTAADLRLNDYVMYDYLTLRKILQITTHNIITEIIDLLKCDQKTFYFVCFEKCRTRKERYGTGS